MFPQHVAERLKDGEAVAAEAHESVTILFADIVNFTSMSSTASPPHRVVALVVAMMMMMIPILLLLLLPLHNNRNKNYIDNNNQVRTEDLFEMLSALYTAFDELVDRHGVHKVDTIGDGEDCCHHCHCHVIVII